MSAIVESNGFLRLRAAAVRALLPATNAWTQLPTSIPLVLVIGPPSEVRGPSIISLYHSYHAGHPVLRACLVSSPSMAVPLVSKLGGIHVEVSID